MRGLLVLLIIVCITGCSSVMSSTAALMVSLHSKKIEKDSRRYKRIDHCVVIGRPEAYMLAEAIVHGHKIATNYKNILNPELREIKPYPSHHLAYAYYVIAERIGDARANGRKETLSGYFEEGQAQKIIEYIDYKYLKSHLTKCFSVPSQYKIRLKDRDLI